MPTERGRQESEPEKEDPVVSALKKRLEEHRRSLHESQSKAGEFAVSSDEKLLEKIKTDKFLYNEVARELGLDYVKSGEQELSSKGMKPKEISEKERERIDRELDIYD